MGRGMSDRLDVEPDGVLAAGCELTQLLGF